MRRKVLSVVGGLAAGALIIAAIEAVNGLLHPPPAIVDPDNLQAYRTYIARLPSGAFVLLLCGRALGSLAAGAIATWMARRAATWPALVAGALLLLGEGLTVIGLPYPAWFIGVDLACYLPLAWLASRLVVGDPAAPGAGAGRGRGLRGRLIRERGAGEHQRAAREQRPSQALVEHEGAERDRDGGVQQGNGADGRDGDARDQPEEEQVRHRGAEDGQGTHCCPAKSSA